MSLSRTRSGRLHAVGSDEAPSTQEMSREDAVNNFSLHPLTLESIEGMTRVHNEGFGGKVCCLCCPVADMDGSIRRYYQQHPERLPMCALAVDKHGTPLGYVQLAIHPMNDKDGLHTTKPGETYVEAISVAAAARGMGIGKLLLQWAEDKSREQKSTLLTLTVLNGNPARRLYERFGFEAKPPTDPCEECIGSCVVCCIMGRPYGLCDPHCGAVDMQKTLV